MSAFRLVVLLVVCACLAVSVRGQSDPTSACYAPNPSADGPAVSDAGYWDLNGLQSTYSSNYLVLCAYRGYYLSGPAGTNTLQWGPWHGNPNDTNCNAPILSQWPNQYERGRPGCGAIAYRTNPATGGKILTSFQICGTCNSDPSNSICAGACSGAPDYDATQAALDQDPTYQVTYFGGSGSTAPVGQPSASTAYTVNAAGPQPQPSGAVNVITTTNSTQYVNGNVTRTGYKPPIYTAIVSAITSLTLCFGLETPACPVA